MSLKKEHHHTIDFIFIIALFAIFTISALLVTLIGTQVYKKSVSSMNDNYTAQTSMAYITEKIHQNNDLDALSIQTVGDSTAIVLSKDYEDTTYNTYIYVYNGLLKELLIKPGQDIHPEAGMTIVEVSDFSIDALGQGLYHITLTDGNGNLQSTYIHTVVSDTATKEGQ